VEKVEIYAGFWWGNLGERNHLENQGVDGRIILIFNSMFNKSPHILLRVPSVGYLYIFFPAYIQKVPILGLSQDTGYPD